MRLIARAASGYPVALGLPRTAGHRARRRAGRHLDIKRGGIIPVVNLVRYHALATGVTISPTLDRIEAVAAAGGLDGDDRGRAARGVRGDRRVRFEHHAQLIGAGRPADNLIDPGALAPIARAELREALQTVKRAQKRLPVWTAPPPACGAQRHISRAKVCSRAPLDAEPRTLYADRHVRDCGAVHEDRDAALGAWPAAGGDARAARLPRSRQRRRRVLP